MHTYTHIYTYIYIYSYIITHIHIYIYVYKNPNIPSKDQTWSICPRPQPCSRVVWRPCSPVGASPWGVPATATEEFTATATCHQAPYNDVSELYINCIYIYIYMCVCHLYIIYIYMFIYTSVGNNSNFLVSNQVLAWAELTCIWRPDGTVVLAGTCCALGIQRSPRTFFLGPRQSHGGASTVSWIVIPMNYSYNLNISQQTLVNLVSESSYKAT